MSYEDLEKKNLKWIQILYTNPTTSVLTNNVGSRFLLGWSTCQGCPLSPLLFILAIEPLAMTIWTQLSGIQLGEQEHQIFLYDVILFLTNLAVSIPSLIQQIELFGKFCSYNINNSKSSILFLNKEERLRLVIDSPFNNAKDG